MQLNISARHDAKLSDSVKEHIHDRLFRSGDHYQKVTRMSVTLDKENQSDIAEASFHINGKELFAKAIGENLYAAIDSLGSKVEKQLLKAKDKQNQKKGVGLKHHAEIISETDEAANEA